MYPVNDLYQRIGFEKYQMSKTKITGYKMCKKNLEYYKETYDNINESRLHKMIYNKENRDNIRIIVNQEKDLILRAL